jgi:hypothetical protein
MTDEWAGLFVLEVQLEAGVEMLQVSAFIGHSAPR